MEHIACAEFGSNAWSGEYKLISGDQWSNADGSYWIYHDDFFWYITDSQFHYDHDHTVATKIHGKTNGCTWVDGPYTGRNGNPDGYVKLGIC